MFYHIQLLRFLCAISVLGAHLILFGNSKYHLGHDNLDFITDYLMIGVDIFFIISGFIMMETVRCNNLNACSINDIKDFFLRRITRIYPLWWSLCFLLLPVFLLKPEWINSGVNEPTSFMHSLFLIPHEGVPLIMVGWTLEYEILFYVFFGLTLFLKKNSQFLVLTLIICSLVCIGFIIDENNKSPIVQILISSLMLYFPLGMMIALFYKIIPNKIWIIALTSVMAILSIIYTIQWRLGDIDRFIHFAPTATLIFLTFVMMDRLQKPKLHALYDWGGKISYAVYIVHILVISVLGRIYNALNFDAPYLLIFIMGFMSIAAAAVLYHGFEGPVLKYFRQVRTVKPLSKDHLSV